MTADEFERAYAARGGVTVQELRAAGRVVRPCHCDYEWCEGWQSISIERAAEWDKQNGNVNMDPNANLREQETCTDQARLLDLRVSLADWLDTGGFEPLWHLHVEASQLFRAWRVNLTRSDARALGLRT